MLLFLRENRVPVSPISFSRRVRRQLILRCQPWMALRQPEVLFFLRWVSFSRAELVLVFLSSLAVIFPDADLLRPGYRRSSSYIYPHDFAPSRKRPGKPGHSQFQPARMSGGGLGRPKTLPELAIGIARGFIASGISRTRSTCRSPFSGLALANRGRER